VRLFVCHNEIHTDLVMPVECRELGIDWRKTFPAEHFSSHVAFARHLAVGWGNRDFYIQTPRALFKFSTACRALFLPSEAVLHVEYLPELTAGPLVHEIYVTREQYQELAAFVRASVGTTDERGCAGTASDVTYGIADRFYAASGRDHLFNTCNQWTGRGLSRAGVPVGIWTPLKEQVLCWLPENETGGPSR
jgi:uncharacterized protein (TIGR02117 family)